MNLITQNLLVNSNNTQTDDPNQCIHQLVESQVKRTPDSIAISLENISLTYRELNNRANQLACYLQTLGVEADALVGICVERSLDMVIGLLGILKAGGAYVPLDPNYPQERLAFMMEDSQCKVLLSNSKQLTRLPDYQAKVVCLDNDWETIAQYSKENLESGVTPDNLAYTIYTSGSTGKPKGVQIIHQALVNFLTSMSQAPGLTQEDVLLAVTTISFDIAGLELYLPMIVGARVVLVTREVVSDAPQLIKVLEQSDATVMQATPATWRMLLAAGWQGDSTLKILCGGEAMSRELANQLLARSGSVWNMYGPTETTIWSAVYQVESGDTAVPIGQPIANTKIHLVDPEQRQKDNQLKLVPVGEPGELLIGGVGLARGYLNQLELTEEKFIPDPFSNEPGARLYRTGDLARYLPDGTIECLGRIDHQVKIRGFRIELGEIESALYQHPGIQETVVTAVEEDLGEKRLVAYLLTDLNVERIPQSMDYLIETQGLSLAHLRSFLKEKLPDYMMPSAFVLLDTLPLTPNLKVDRKALPAPNQAKLVLMEEFVPPRNPLEQQLVQIWIEVLKIKRVGIHDSFFELGGHSLLTAQLLSQIRKTFQVELPLLSLFEAPTIAKLAQEIAVVQNSQSNSPQTSTTVEELRTDAILEPSIYPELPYTNSGTEPQHIFLTGATGFLGAFLLHELLQQTEATIHCLVRCPSLEAGKQKLRSNLKRYLLPDESFEHRIVPVPGDLTKPMLGLSGQQFHKLATEVDSIYHNGAFVNLIYPYTALQTANVLGTKEILKLASQIKVKPVHFISTLDVFQSPYYAGMDVISEDISLGCEGLSDGYAQSKWVGEQLVMAAHARGIPGCIYRPSMITGHSQSGASSVDDLITRLIKGLIQLGCAPNLDMKLSLTPVDYVSRAIVHLSQQPASFGKAFHIVSPHALHFRELVKSIQEFGYFIQWSDYEQWQAKLLKVASAQADNALSPLLFLFTDWVTGNERPYLETAALVSQAFDYQNTLAGLAGTNAICPAVDSGLLQTYFAYLLKGGEFSEKYKLAYAA